MPSSESPTSNLLAQRIGVFDAAARNAQIYLSITRDGYLQRAVILELRNLAKSVEDWKQEAIAEKNNDSANLFLGMSCIISALVAELDMWLLLKEEEPDKAWYRLISAQTATLDALRAHNAFQECVSNVKRLDAIEKLVFPPQVFFSSGLIVQLSFCSICGSEYGDCSHLLGKPYMGELCRRLLKDVVADHVAIVSEPANKRCRVVHFSTKGGKRNRMTWRIEPDETQSATNEEIELTAQGIIISANDFES